MKKLIQTLLLALSLSALFILKQQSANAQAPKKLQINNMSDEQIKMYMSQAQSAGLTNDQISQLLLSQGASIDDIVKLKSHPQGVGYNTPPMLVKPKPQANAPKKRDINFQPDSSAHDSPTLGAASGQIFGASLFRNSKLLFEPHLRIATPENYIIGPEDEILIDITGDNEASYALKVSPEGTINVEYAGLISVSGLTIEQARRRIKTKLAYTYPSIRKGSTLVSVNIGNIRSIKVTLLGEVVKPGSYTLPSLASVFNALYESGGPTKNGSFRQIEVIRHSKVITKLDMYDFLLRGDQSKNISLQDQDIIRIPTYQVRVELVGEIKRPGLYEVLPGEHLSDIINFSGGFTDEAYTAHIKATQVTSTERRVIDIDFDAFATYTPKRGDKYLVDKILNRFENRVEVTGAVFRPGMFELSPGLTASALIKKANGVKEDAFMHRAYIRRKMADNSPEFLAFDLEKLLTGQAPDILLKREDRVEISSIFDLRDEATLNIQGQVRQPGTYKFAENMTLEDLIILAGGFAEGATSQRVEISRIVKNSNVNSTSRKTAQTFQLNIEPNLNFKNTKFVLEPYDIVVVRSLPGYEKQRLVQIGGEVLYPGYYAITNKSERVSDLVKRAGGLTAMAYPEGGSLKRPGASATPLSDTTDTSGNWDREKLTKIKRLQQIQTDNVALDTIQQQAVLKNTHVGIDLKYILENPGNGGDLLLEEGDILYVPKLLQTVKVSGEVLYPMTALYSKEKTFKEYISQGGGFSQHALRRRSYVIYANGSVQGTRKFLFFNSYPSVKPGSEIFIPTKAPRQRLKALEVIGISSALATMGGSIIGLLNLIKK